MWSKAILVPLILTPVAMSPAQGFLYVQQPCPQGVCAAPQSPCEVIRREYEPGHISIQIQPQSQWRPIPFDTCWHQRAAEQGSYLNQLPTVYGGYPPSTGPVWNISPSIDNGTHISPPVRERPVLRVPLLRRTLGAGRTT